MNNKNHPEGEKQAGRRLEHSQIWNSHDVRQRISPGLQTQGDYIGRQTRVTRETQLEPLKQWLRNKMGGDRQSTWEHMAPTNNKPCAQHTETSGGQPGHTSRTVTVTTSFCDRPFTSSFVKFVFLIITPYFCWRLLLSLKWTNKGDMKQTTPFQCFRKPAPEAAANRWQER